MNILFGLIWAAMELCFAHLLLSSFLAVRRSKTTVALTLLVAWLLIGLYGLFAADGVQRYFMYLLAVTFLLLGIYDEYGPRGLGLLLLAFLIPFGADAAAAHLAGDAQGLPRYLAVTLGKAFPVLFALALNRLRRPDRQAAMGGDSEALLLRQHMEMQQESMNALEQNYRIQRESTHEFEHHLQVLRDLLAQGETGAARDYLHRLRKDRSIHAISVTSGHPVVDVILNQKYQGTRQNEIKMQVQVNDLSGLRVPSDSLAVILTNLLDNAMEACLRIDGYREIFCSLLYDEGLYLSIRNTSAPVSIVDGKIPTSKQDSLSHGFGLLSVSYVLDGLGAEYTFGYEDGWFHFTAEIE